MKRICRPNKFLICFSESYSTYYLSKIIVMGRPILIGTIELLSLRKLLFHPVINVFDVIGDTCYALRSVYRTVPNLE